MRKREAAEAEELEQEAEEGVEEGVVEGVEEEANWFKRKVLYRTRMTIINNLR